MRKVRIVQLLCPHRHCILASAYESADGKPIPEMTARLRQAFHELLKTGAHASCGICGSVQLLPEDSATVFTTMQEAAPALAEAAERQAKTRGVLSGGKELEGSRE